MVIVETSNFSKQVAKSFTDEQYRALQNYLINRPDAGVVIPSGGGIRKLRWAGSGRGKRGGLRLIYYWAVSQNHILLLFLFPKNERDDLTKKQLSILRSYIEEHYP